MKFLFPAYRGGDDYTSPQKAEQRNEKTLNKTNSKKNSNLKAAPVED